MSYSISQLGRQFGLSRSTLLYYDKLGLLSPSQRSDANYRRYSEADRQRLARIVAYRDTGMPLQDIKPLLAVADDDHRVAALEARLEQLNRDIAGLREQQRITLQLLGGAGGQSARRISKQQWVDLLAASGMSDEDMDNWHREFERAMPEAHQDFLESLDIPADEIRKIRRQSRG